MRRRHLLLQIALVASHSKLCTADPVASDDDAPRLRVFLEVSLVLLLLATAWQLQRRRVIPSPDADAVDVIPSVPSPPSSAQVFGIRRDAALSLLRAFCLVSYGVLGLAMTLQATCPSSRWLVVLCIALASGCGLCGIIQLTQTLASTVTLESSTLLTCLRCSCCSRLTKRMLLLPPLTLLAASNGASWLETRDDVTSCASTALSPASFFGGAAVLLSTMLVAATLAVACSFRSSRRCPAAGKAAVAVGLAAFALVAVGWAILGCLQLRSAAMSCWTETEARQAAYWTVAELWALGGLLLATTCCCRLENFFLAATTAAVDVSSLSPRLSAMKSAVNAAATASEARPPQLAALV